VLDAFPLVISQHLSHGFWPLRKNQNVPAPSNCVQTLVIIALFVIGYVAYWQYQYKRAESAANDFCATVELESDIAKTIALLGAKETMHHGFQENQSRYVVIFKGPIFNAYTCELALTDRKVTSKRVVAPVD
jgi:hypothetical protein